jgi:hypothetical protein
MKKKPSNVQFFAEKHSPFIALAIAMVMAGTCVAIDHYDTFSLQGTATPMYGSMPNPSLHSAASASSVTSTSATSSRKAEHITDERRAKRFAKIRRFLERLRLMKAQEAQQ